MDTSPEYINMCRKARELQESWSPRMGDFGIYDQQLVIMGSDGTPLVRHIVARNCIWLPRIDQMCNMLRGHYNRFSPIIWTDIRIMCSVFESENNSNIINETISVEQYMLMELYNVAYHKTWNGEDWIKT